jgi:hypothetical protein
LNFTEQLITIITIGLVDNQTEIGFRHVGMIWGLLEIEVFLHGHAVVHTSILRPIYAAVMFGKRKQLALREGALFAAVMVTALLQFWNVTSPSVP